MSGTPCPDAAPTLWAATASAPPPGFGKLSGGTETDVLIIGGGFTGLSVALHLAEQGVDACLMEAEGIGHGASGRNGGQVNPGVKLGEDALTRKFGEAGRGLFRLGEEAVDFLAGLVARKGLRCAFHCTGLIRLAHSAAAMRKVREARDGLAARGIDARLLSAGNVEETVGTRRYVGGLRDPRGATVQPLDLARELARVSAEAGARVFIGSPATRLHRVGARWQVDCGTGRVLAKTVVVATNAYTDGLVPRLARSVLPVNSFQIATAPLPPELDRAILPGREAVYDSRRLILYFRKSSDNRLVLGGRASFSSSANDRARRADYDVLRVVLAGIFPQLAGVDITHRWTGLVCITPDYLPHYHAPEPGLHVALGFNGRGVAMSVRSGAWLANKITGRPDSGDMPVSAIRPIPLHRIRQPVLNAAMVWNRLMDAVGH